MEASVARACCPLLVGFLPLAAGMGDNIPFLTLLG